MANDNKIFISLGDIPCVHPDITNDYHLAVLKHLSSLGIKINGATKRSGFDHTFAHVLLLKEDLDTLDRVDLDLKIQEGDEVIDVLKLSILDTRTFAPLLNKNALVWVHLVDDRYLPPTQRSGLNFEHFPPHPKYSTDEATFATNWVDAIDLYWTDTLIPGSLDQSANNYPTILLRDVETENTKGAFDTLNDILDLSCHGLYSDGSDYKTIPFNDTASRDSNKELADKSDSVGREMSKRNDVSGFKLTLPESINVKYRKIDKDIYNQQLEFGVTYSGSLDNGSFIRDMNVYNLFDEVWDNKFNDGDQIQELSDLANELAQLFFSAVDAEISVSLNTIYFGVIPFVHSPSADYIEYYFDPVTGSYNTLVRSLDLKQHQFPEFDRHISEATLDETVVLQRCSDGLELIAEDVLLGGSLGLLSDNIGKVVKIKVTSTLEQDCWIIVSPSDCKNGTCPTICAIYDSCIECEGCWKLTLCVSPFTEIITTSKFICSAGGGTIEDGSVVLLDDDKCYIATKILTCTGAVPVVVVKIVENCDDCITCYELTRCHSSETKIVFVAGINILGIDQVVKIDGECWTVTDEDICINLTGIPVHLDESPETFFTCVACGCYLLINCDEVTADLLVNFAEDADSGNPLDLSELVGDVVRTVDGDCWTVTQTLIDCDLASTSATIIQESYGSDCADCVCTILISCANPGVPPGGLPLTGGDVITYTDLSGLVVGDIFFDLNSGLCYKVGVVTPWVVSALRVTVDTVWPQGDCTDCSAPIYELVANVCPTCEDLQPLDDTSCDADGGGAVLIAGGGTSFFTDDDLSASVGKYVRFERICYLVELAESDDTPVVSGLTLAGPFDNCETCQMQCAWMVIDVTDETTKLDQKLIKVMLPMICEEKIEKVIDIEDCVEEVIAITGTESLKETIKRIIKEINIESREE